ncbi:MAG: hypothetical protein K0R70_237 [Steroidobacteraceae bacterium]|nr:hypothetical protein [Steroidobacteraceae bacterium]
MSAGDRRRGFGRGAGRDRPDRRASHRGSVPGRSRARRRPAFLHDERLRRRSRGRAHRAGTGIRKPRRRVVRDAGRAGIRASSPPPDPRRRARLGRAADADPRGRACAQPRRSDRRTIRPVRGGHRLPGTIRLAARAPRHRARHAARAAGQGGVCRPRHQRTARGRADGRCARRRRAPARLRAAIVCDAADAARCRRAGKLRDAHGPGAHGRAAGRRADLRAAPARGQLHRGRAVAGAGPGGPPHADGHGVRRLPARAVRSLAARARATGLPCARRGRPAHAAAVGRVGPGHAASLWRRGGGPPAARTPRRAARTGPRCAGRRLHATPARGLPRAPRTRRARRALPRRARLRAALRWLVRLGSRTRRRRR